MNLPYWGWRTSRWVSTRRVLVVLSPVTIPVTTRRAPRDSSVGALVLASAIGYFPFAGWGGPRWPGVPAGGEPDDGPLRPPLAGAVGLAFLLGDRPGQHVVGDGGHLLQLPPPLLGLDPGDVLLRLGHLAGRLQPVGGR